MVLAAESESPVTANLGNAAKIGNVRRVVTAISTLALTFVAETIALLCIAMRLRYALRILASLAITASGTTLFALVLSWFKQGIR